MIDDAGNDQRWPPREGPKNFEPSHEAWEFVPREAAPFCRTPPYGDCGYPTAKYPDDVVLKIKAGVL